MSSWLILANNSCNTEGIILIQKPLQKMWMCSIFFISPLIPPFMKSTQYVYKHVTNLQESWHIKHQYRSIEIVYTCKPYISSIIVCYTSIIFTASITFLYLVWYHQYLFYSMIRVLFLYSLRILNNFKWNVNLYSFL